MVITVKAAIQGPAAITAELGVQIREMYGNRWHSESIEFDFAGVRSVSPSFLSQATMPVVLAYSKSDLARKLIFRNTPATFDLVWQTVLRAAETIRNSATDAA